MSADFNSIQKDLKGESKENKIILGSAAIVFISVFLPWVSFGNMYYSRSVNGMSGMGIFSMIASAAVLALWIMPKMGVKLPLDTQQKKMTLKALVVVMAIPALYYFLQMITNGGISMVGLGLWLAVIASGAAIYVAFMGCKKKVNSNTSAQKAPKVEAVKEKEETPKNEK